MKMVNATQKACAISFRENRIRFSNIHSQQSPIIPSVTSHYERDMKMHEVSAPLLASADSSCKILV